MGAGAVQLRSGHHRVQAFHFAGFEQSLDVLGNLLIELDDFFQRLELFLAIKGVVIGANHGNGNRHFLLGDLPFDSVGRGCRSSLAVAALASQLEFEGDIVFIENSVCDGSTGWPTIGCQDAGEYRIVGVSASADDGGLAEAVLLPDHRQGGIVLQSVTHRFFAGNVLGRRLGGGVRRLRGQERGQAQSAGEGEIVPHV